MKVEVPFKQTKKQSIKDNLALYYRVKKLKERALKLIKEGEKDKNENTNA